MKNETEWINASNWCTRWLLITDYIVKVWVGPSVYYLSRIFAKLYAYQLQKKSGQAVFTQQQEKLGKTTSIDKLSDDSAAATSFAQVFEEMNAFDVRCGNPVRTKQNPPSMSNSLYWATSFLSEWDGETSIVSSAGDELEEESGGEEEEEGDLGDEGQLDGGAAEILGESGESQ